MSCVKNPLENGFLRRIKGTSLGTKWWNIRSPPELQRLPFYTKSSTTVYQIGHKSNELRLKYH